MRRITPQFILLNQGTYPFDVLVAINKTDEEVFTHLKKNYNVDLSEEEKVSVSCVGNGRSSRIKSGQIIIQIRASHLVQFHHVAAHEIFHAVEFLFELIGLKHTLDSGEAYAYQIQHLTDQLYRSFYDKKRK